MAGVKPAATNVTPKESGENIQVAGQELVHNSESFCRGGDFRVTLVREVIVVFRVGADLSVLVIVAVIPAVSGVPFTPDTNGIHTSGEL